MNELLQKHGCSNVFTIPDGLKELMADISREVLREQPVQICDFIANYLSALLITREHGVMAVKILDDLCDCRPSISEHLIQIGMQASEARVLSEIINEEIQSVHMVEGKEKVKEAEILKRVLKRNPLDEEMTAKVCQIARNAYRDYWYRKKMLEQNLKINPDEPWEIAAQHTLEIYKRTKPSFTDLTRATQKIQAAYRGYHVRRQMLGHLKPRKKQAPKVDLLGPPVDIAESREIDLGLVVDINDQVKVDDMSTRFMEDDHQKLGLGYDTMKTITQVQPSGGVEFDPTVTGIDDRERGQSRMLSTKSMKSETFGAKEAGSRKSMAGMAESAMGPSAMGIDDRERGQSKMLSTKSMKSETFGAKEAVSRKSMAGISESATGPSEAVSRKSMAGMTETATGPSEAVSRKSMAGMTESEMGPPTETDTSYFKSDADDAPLPPGTGPDSRIKFAPIKETDVQEIPEELAPTVTVGEGDAVSEQPTPTFDLELSSAASKTMSVPTSASTTAPTSDIEDIATSEAEEEEEE